MFYSKTTGGFYDREIHGDNIPSDAVEITIEQHAALLEGQANGKRIVADEDGFPVLADRPALTDEELQQLKNAEARAYLASTDWYVTRFAETGEPVPDDVKAKRQAARESVA